MKVNLKKNLSIIALLAGALSLQACANKAYLEDYTKEQEQVKQEYYYDKYTFLGECARRESSAQKGLYYMAERADEKGKWLGGWNIYYYDFDKKASDIWCNELACEHDNVKCTAYYDEASQYEFIEWHNGKVYKIFYDDAGIYLERFEEDGSGQQRIINLLPEDESVTKIKPGKFYNNKFYYAIRNEQEEFVYYCVDLQNAEEVKKLFALECGNGVKMSISGMFINDECIYQSFSKYNSEDKSYERNVYQYSFAKQTATLILSGSEDIRIGVNDYLYYFDGESRLYRIDSSGAKEEIAQGKFSEIKGGYGITCNENYIIFDNDVKGFLGKEERVIYVYNIQKNVLNKLEEAVVKEDMKEIKEEELANVISPMESVLSFPLGADAKNYYVYDSNNMNRIYAIDLDSVFDDEMSYSYINY